MYFLGCKPPEWSHQQSHEPQAPHCVVSWEASRNPWDSWSHSEVRAPARTAHLLPQESVFLAEHFKSFWCAWKCDPLPCGGWQGAWRWTVAVADETTFVESWQMFPRRQRACIRALLKIRLLKEVIFFSQTQTPNGEQFGDMLGLPYTIPQAGVGCGHLNSRNLISPSFVDWKVWDQGMGRVGFWWSCSLWLANHCLLAVPSHGLLSVHMERERSLVSLLTRTPVLSD